MLECVRRIGLSTMPVHLYKQAQLSCHWSTLTMIMISLGDKCSLG